MDYKVFVTTTETLDGYRIKYYSGPVFASIIMGYDTLEETPDNILIATGRALEDLKRQTSERDSNVILNFTLNHISLPNALLTQASGMAATVVTEEEYDDYKEEIRSEREWEQSEEEYRQSKIDKARDKIFRNIENAELAFNILMYLIDHYGISATDIYKNFPRSISSDEFMKTLKDLEREEIIYQTEGVYYDSVL